MLLDTALRPETTAFGNEFCPSGAPCPSSRRRLWKSKFGSSLRYKTTPEVDVKPLGRAPMHRRTGRGNHQPPPALRVWRDHRPLVVASVQSKWSTSLWKSAGYNYVVLM